MAACITPDHHIHGINMHNAEQLMALTSSCCLFLLFEGHQITKRNVLGVFIQSCSLPWSKGRAVERGAEHTSEGRFSGLLHQRTWNIHNVSKMRTATLNSNTPKHSLRAEAARTMHDHVSISLASRQEAITHSAYLHVPQARLPITSSQAWAVVQVLADPNAPGLMPQPQHLHWCSPAAVGARLGSRACVQYKHPSLPCFHLQMKKWSRLQWDNRQGDKRSRLQVSCDASQAAAQEQRCCSCAGSCDGPTDSTHLRAKQQQLQAAAACSQAKGWSCCAQAQHFMQVVHIHKEARNPCVRWSACSDSLKITGRSLIKICKSS